MTAIGADLDKRICRLAMQGEDGQLTMLPSIENERENWLALPAKLPPQAEIAPEVSTQWSFCDECAGGGGWR